MKLLLRKGYEYVVGEIKFNDTQFSERKQFANALTESEVTNKDCVHAQAVWSAFNMRKFGDYHDLYLKTDVLFLADVFENSRNTS